MFGYFIIKKYVYQNETYLNDLDEKYIDHIITKLDIKFD